MDLKYEWRTNINNYLKAIAQDLKTPILNIINFVQIQLVLPCRFF